MTSITFFIIFIPILSILLLLINLVLAPHNPYQEKDSAFECGYHSFLGQNRTQFSVSFFLVAILYLLFDLEIVLVYPYSVSGDNNGGYGLVIMMIFFVLLTLGFIFELGKNALTIDSKQVFSQNNVNVPELLILISKTKGREISFNVVQSNIYSPLKYFAKYIYNYLLSKAKNFILDKAIFYAGKLFSRLRIKYPRLYKIMYYLFSNISTINSCFHCIVSRIHITLKSKYPRIYSFFLYLYSESLAIMNGDLTINVFLIITSYVIYDFNSSSSFMYMLLLLNNNFKEYLNKDTWIKSKYPRLFGILFGISAFVNACLISYFLECIVINIIKPLIQKIWNSLLKMAGNSGNTPQGSDPSGGSNPKGPNPEKPEDNFSPNDTSRSKNKQRAETESNETLEQRDARLEWEIELAREREYSRNRRENETLEQRDARLDWDLDKTHRWIERRNAKETPEQTEARKARSSYTNRKYNATRKDAKRERENDALSRYLDKRKAQGMEVYGEQTNRNYPTFGEQTNRNYPTFGEQTNRNYPNFGEQTNRNYPVSQEQTTRNNPVSQEQTRNNPVSQEQTRNNPVSVKEKLDINNLLN